MQSTNSNSCSSTWSSTDSMSSLEAPLLLPHERLHPLQPLSSPHSSLLRRQRRGEARHLAPDSDSESSAGSFPFPDMGMNPVSDGSRSSSSSSSSSSSTDSNETIKMPLFPHEQFTLASPWASKSSMDSPSSTLMARRIQIAKNRCRRHPLLRDLEHMERAAEQYGYASSVLEPELQYEQGSWFPSSSSSSSSTGTTTTTILPPDNGQRHWGEFCASPELMTPVDDDDVRRSLQPLFDMQIFGNDDNEESSVDDMEGLGAYANNETETDIISSLEEGYLPPATATKTQICDDDEEAGAMKRSESLISFKDLNIPPPKAPAAAPIAALKRRVNYVCETATGMVKGSKTAVATSSFVGNLFDYLIEKGF